MRLLIIISALCILLSSWSDCSLVLAQSGATTGSIVGTVKDSQDGIIVGATVVARELNTNFTREMTIGEDGLYQFIQLPPGKYQLIVQASGFEEKQADLVLDIGRTEVIKFTLPVQSASEVIEVTAAATLTDELKSESSTNIDNSRINGLPINQRNFLTFALTSPRATADRLPVQGASATSGLSFNGQSARNNNVTIDGLSNNDIATGSVRSTFSQDAVQEFQIVADSYAAEFGRALGGVINIVTKTGSNQFNGTLFFLDRNDKVSAREVFAAFKPSYSQYQVGATISGPIKRDRAFFFTSLERLSIKQLNVVTIRDESISAARRVGFNLSNGPIPVAIGNTTVLGRIDMQLNANNRANLRYNFGGAFNGAFDPFGGLVGETRGSTQRLNDNSIAFSNIYVNAGLNLVNETRLLYGRRNQIAASNGTGPGVSIVAPEGQIDFGPINADQIRQERIYQIVDIVSLSRGRHQIKFGVDDYFVDTPGRKSNLELFNDGIASFVPINFSTLFGIANLPSFTALQAFDPSLRTSEQINFLKGVAPLLPQFFAGFPTNVPLADLSIPLVYTQGFGDTRLVVKTNFFTLFAQDDFKVRPNLLVKFGLRYDLNRVSFRPDNNGNFSPRLGFSYRPARLQQLALHASYGLFFDAAQTAPSIISQLSASGALTIDVMPFPFSILPFAQPGHQLPRSNQLPPGIKVIPQLNQTFQYQKDLRNSYAHQASAGIDYNFDKDSTLSLAYAYVRGVKLFATRSINPIVRPIPGDILGSVTTGRLFPDVGPIGEFEAAFDSYYHGLSIIYNRRFNGRFSVLASYTFSKAIDNLFDARTDVADKPVDALKPGNERGLSIQDVRSRFVLSGLLNLSNSKNILLRDLQLSTIMTFNSGRPYNLLAGQDLNFNGDNGDGDRPDSLGRNVGITPGFANIDMRLTRTISIKEHYQAQLFVEAFNLFNRVNISQVDRIFPPDAQGNFHLPEKQGSRYIAPSDRYRNAFPPRQLQFGFRFSF